MRDPKNSFYKYLNLDKKTMQVIRFYRQITKEMLNDEYEKDPKIIEEIRNEQI